MLLFLDEETGELEETEVVKRKKWRENGRSKREQLISQ